MSKNLATTTIASHPGPPTSATSVTVATGTGSRLYVGMAVIHPANTTPTPASAEVVSITDVTGDVLTIVRAQESSTARAIATGDVITQGITAAMWDTLVASNAAKADAAATTSALAGKANTSHTHSAADVTSGTLPLARGGTGGTDASTARTSLGLGTAATQAATAFAPVASVTTTLGAVSTATTGTLVAGQMAQIDATAAAAARTLPAANSVAAGTVVGVKKVDGSANAVTVSRAGADTITGTALAQTSRALTLAGESVEFTSDGTSAWVITSTDTPSPALNATYGRLAGANTWTGAQDFTGATVTGIAGGGGSGTVGSVADITALRAVAISGAVPQIVRSTGALYAPSGGSTATDDGLTVVAPNTGSGRWVLAQPATQVMPFGMGMSRLSKARTGVFRVLQCGTSISTFDNAPNQVLVDRLKAIYGDAGESWTHGGALGGSYDNSFNGWKKQAYGGPLYVRARGESTSSDLTFSGYFDRVTIEVSKDTGGATCAVQIDGVSVGTLDSSGTQQYGVAQTFTTTLGYHTVTIVKPASGFVFLERLRLWTSTATGVEVLDTTLGGSSLRNTSVLRVTAGDSVAGIAVSGTNGIDAHFGRTDIDLFLCSHLVNDISQASWWPTNWQAAIDRAVALTAATQTPLVWIIEMAGHNIMPNDAGSSSNFTQFNAMRAYLLKAARENDHVYALDWHGMTSMTDIAAYATLYYSNVTSLNISAGTYSGDFIHPTTFGARVGTQGLCAAFGLDPSAYETKSASQDDRYTALGQLASGTATVLGETRTFPVQIATAVRLGGGAGGGVKPLTTPVYRDNGVVNFDSALNALIAASGTSDSTGKYLDLSNAASYFLGNYEIGSGERVTITMLASGNIAMRTNTNGRFFLAGTNGGVAIGAGNQTVSFTSTTPKYVTVEYSNAVTGADWVALSGRVYAIWVTRSGGVPIVTTKPYASLHRVGPPAVLVGDPVFDTGLVGQQFVEDVFGPAVVTKKLVGACWKWSTSTQAFYRAGLYECVDRTSAGYRLARVDNGTITYPTNAWSGGNAESTTGTARLALGSVSIATAGTMTFTWRPIVAGNCNWRLSFFNGGNNFEQWLAPDGTWTTTATAVFSTNVFRVGEPVSVSFVLPTDTVNLGTTPQLKLSPVGSGTTLSTGVLVKGSSALV